VKKYGTPSTHMSLQKRYENAFAKSGKKKDIKPVAIAIIELCLLGGINKPVSSQLKVLKKF